MEKIKKSAAELRNLLSKSSSEARNIISSLFDIGTFVEFGSYVKNSSADTSEFEGVITGCGAVNGRLVYAFVQDFSNKKGAFGESHAKKILNAFDMAIKSGAPIVGVFNSAGANVMEGIDALSGYGKIMKTSAKAKGLIPQIAIISGVCSASSAALCGMFDFRIIASDKAQIFVNSPFVLGADAKSTVENAVNSGFADIVSDTTLLAIAEAKNLLSYIPANTAEAAPEVEADDINRATPEIASIIANEGYKVSEVISACADFGKIYEITADFAPEIKTAFIKIGGKTVAVCANDQSYNEGALTPDAAKKAASFVAYCDAFDIPLLTLVDAGGFKADIESEQNCYAEKLARLASAYAASENIKVTCVIGRAFGAAYTVMGSKSVGADITFALENAKISIMAPDTAVEFLGKDEINSAKDPKSKREQLISEWNNTFASPVSAAKSGDIDDIIACDELRQRIAAALEILSFKGRGF